MAPPREQSLLAELIVLRPAGSAGSASALCSSAPPSGGAAFGGDERPAAEVAARDRPVRAC